MPLTTGASLITLSLLLNKMSGLYGILALLTGYHLSPFQLSMYIYSIIALSLTVVLSRHIKTGSPFHCLALAWLYVVDSVINAAYTAAFAVTWFLLLSGQKKGPGASTIDETSGFTDPAHNVSRVSVGQEGIEGVVPAAEPASTSNTPLILDTQSINSIGIIATLWTFRAYFCLVMLSWARQVIRQHIAVVSIRSGQYGGSAANKGLADNPFADTKPEGQGWKGKLGRVMVNIGKGYFLAADEADDNESWVQNVSGRFKTSKNSAGSAGEGGIMLGKITPRDQRPTERERRRRAGTGPPEPTLQAEAAVAAAVRASSEESTAAKFSSQQARS